jgi:hypothetical protein
MCFGVSSVEAKAEDVVRAVITLAAINILFFMYFPCLFYFNVYLRIQANQ